MGNCNCRPLTTKVQPPECRHERLNEHNDRYFAKVQARNSTVTNNKRWWRKTQKTEEEGLSHWDSPVLTDPCVTLEHSSEDDNIGSIVTHTDSSHEVGASHPPSNFGFPMALSTTSMSASSFSPPKTISKKQLLTADAGVVGWQVKRKGNALQLRLAKNRFLQLAVNNDSNKGMNPITLDSDLQSTRRPKRTFNPLESPKEQDETNDFDSAISSGMVWVEVARTVLVTAVAMSRRSWAAEATTSPLLMAVGGHDGVVTLTEILDEHHPPIGIGIDPSSENSSSLRKFGETLEFVAQRRIRSLDFSPDGQYLVIGGDGCTATFLRIILHPHTHVLQNVKVLAQVERVDRVYTVQFSPDSSTLAIGGFDGQIAFCSVSSLLSQATPPPLAEVSRLGLVFCLDWSPDGKFVAVGGSDKHCAILDSSSFNLVHETLRSTAVQALKWSPDCSKLAIGDREVVILDGETFAVKCEISNTPTSLDGASASRYRISSLCWSPDGSFLAVGGSDGICLVVETKGYALVHEIHRSGGISCLAWGQQRINTSGIFRRYLAVCDESCNVALLKAGAEIDGYISESDEVSSAASSSYFSTGTCSDWILRDDSFRDMDDTTPEPPREITPQGNITAVGFSKASKTRSSSYLAYAADDCSLTIMTTRDWKAVFQMEFAKPILSLMFSHSNNYLALGGEEGVLYVLSVPSRSIIFNTIFTTPIRSIAFSRHDERLAIGADDGALSLLCPDADWEPVGEMDYSDSPILAQDWCLKTLVIGRADGSVAVFDTEKAFSNFFVPLAEFSHSLPVRSVAFGSSGRFLVVGGDSGVVSILSSKGGWVLCNQIKLGCNILSMKWSPAGRYLAFTGTNKTCRIMDTITWVEVNAIEEAVASIFNSESNSSVSAIDWSVDGKWVALGSTGGGIHVLSTSGWQLLAPSSDRLRLSSQALKVKSEY